MKSDHQQPGNSSYSTFVSIETGDTNASMLTTDHHTPAEHPQSHDSACADWCEPH